MKITFNGDLIELLKIDNNHGSLEMTLKEKRSANDVIQSLRIPHTEVSHIRVNDKAVPDLAYVIQPGDQVEVFPISPPQRDTNSQAPQFILDVHLWKLARRLRLLGFDIAFNPQWEDPQLAEISQQEGRKLLTRDRGLLMRSQVTSGLLVRNTNTDKQVVEILRRLNLKSFIRPFIRCIMCNELLQKVDMNSELFKHSLAHTIPAKVSKWCRDYRYCRKCNKLYWNGSHVKKLITKIQNYRHIT
jgi:uncharacterized protein